MLQRLVSVLESRGVVLEGRRERRTSSVEEAAGEAMMSKTSKLKSTLDQFEKWIGIIRVDCSSDKNCSVTESVRGMF